MRFLRSDVTRILIYIICCFLLAAVITPHIYNAGKALADVTAHKQTNDFIDWLGGAAGRAEYSRFFKRCLTFSTLILMPLLIISLKMSARRRIDDGPLALDSSTGSYYSPLKGQVLQPNNRKSLHLFIGFLLSAPLFLLMGYFTTLIDYYEWRNISDWSKVFRKSIPPAIFTSVLEECIFRGALLGIFIRCLKPLKAIIALSLIFSAVHFLMPPSGLAVQSPEASDSGFRFLGLVASRITAPSEFFGEFLTLFVVGLILAYARFRTASLWLSIGLHTGWIFAFKFFHRVVKANSTEDRSSILLGDDLRSGLLPLVVLSCTAGLLYFYLSLSSSKESATDK